MGLFQNSPIKFTFYVSLRKESRLGLKKHEDELMLTELSFLGELSL